MSVSGPRTPEFFVRFTNGEVVAIDGKPLPTGDTTNYVSEYVLLKRQEQEKDAQKKQ